MPRNRGLHLVVACVLVLLGSARHADAQDFFFGFLIDKGWQTFTANPVVRVDQTLISWSADRPFHAIVNGQKGAQLGQAFVRAWYRSVPDPFYAPIGPTAGVITLDFGGMRGHLSLIETPTGFQTTISTVEGWANLQLTGTWVFGNGADVIGGSADDMVIGGVVHLSASATSLGAIELPVNQYFPTVPFPSDNNPLALQSVNVTTQLGSYYGQSEQRPVRTYRRFDAQWTGLPLGAWLAVVHVPGSGYLIAVETHLSEQSGRTTTSGVGIPLFAHLTGGFYMSFLPGFVWKLLLQPYVAP